jgi:hypothetical protein
VSAAAAVSRSSLPKAAHQYQFRTSSITFLNLLTVPNTLHSGHISKLGGPKVKTMVLKQKYVSKKQIITTEQHVTHSVQSRDFSFVVSCVFFVCLQLYNLYLWRHSSPPSASSSSKIVIEVVEWSAK